MGKVNKMDRQPGSRKRNGTTDLEDDDADEILDDYDIFAQ
jgi:hypothetical protein